MSGIGSVIGGLLGGAEGANSGPPSVNRFYGDVPQVGTQYGDLLGKTTENTNALQPATGYATQTFNKAYNNPYSSLLQTGAGNASGAYNTTGQQGLNNSTALSSSSNSLLSYINQILSQGANPQGNLFNQQSQRATDQANVTNAQNGIIGPYAAGVTNQANQNFNTDWQDKALSRAIQALTSGASTLNAAGSGMNTATSLGEQGGQDIYTGAGLPYNTANTITGNQSQDINSLINSIGGVNNIDTSTMSQLLQYLNSASGYAIGQNQASSKNAAAGASGGSELGGFAEDAIMSLF